MRRLNPIILLIDDDLDGLYFSEEAFKKLGADCVIKTVDGGEQAIAYIQGKGKYSDRSVYAFPDFIMTDLKMPGTDGFGVLDFLKQDSRTATIPVVVFSGSNDNDDIRKAYQMGASSYHLKPVNVTELRLLIKTLYDFWLKCELPDRDMERKPETGSVQKLGSRWLSSTPPTRAEGTVAV